MAGDTYEVELNAPPPPPPPPAQSQTTPEQAEALREAYDVLKAGIVGTVGGAAVGGLPGAVVGGVAGVSAVMGAHDAGTAQGERDAAAANKK